MPIVIDDVQVSVAPEPSERGAQVAGPTERLRRFEPPSLRDQLDIIARRAERLRAS